MISCPHLELHHGKVTTQPKSLVVLPSCHSNGPKITIKHFVSHVELPKHIKALVLRPHVDIDIMKTMFDRHIETLDFSWKLSIRSHDALSACWDKWASKAGGAGPDYAFK